MARRNAGAQAAPSRPRARTPDIKRGDMVYVLSGADREESRLSEEQLERTPPARLKAEAERHAGKRGRVIRVLPAQGRVVVEGVNLQIKHARPRGRTTRVAQMQTGRITQPGPVAASKVMLVCPRCDRPTRVRRGEIEGRRLRICRRCGEPVDQL